jgi:hypothetical protein
VKLVQSLLLLIGALSVLALGAVSASASPVAAPCHESGHASQEQTPGPAPKAMKAMTCCVACMATPTLDPAPVSTLSIAPSRLPTERSTVPSGRRLSPEPGPPRLLIA